MRTAQRVPEANVRWQNEEAVPLPSADVGVAVATDSGLIVPIVFGAHRMNVLEIAETVKVKRNLEIEPLVGFLIRSTMISLLCVFFLLLPPPPPPW